MNSDANANNNILARRPYNVYNIFFILERARLLQDSTRDAIGVNNVRKQSSSCELFGFDQLNLPELPPRYHDLQLPPDWYVPSGKSKNRKHVATNGLQNFASLAQTVASNWKVVDTDTLNYCNTVAHMIKERHSELTKGGVMKHQHTSAKKKKKSGPTTMKLKPIKSNALKEVVDLRNPLYSSPPSSSSADVIFDMKNNHIFTQDATDATAWLREEYDADRQEEEQQWIDEVTSMPFTSSKFLNQNEQTNHLFANGMHLVEIPTIHPPEPSVVTPPAEVPSIDDWNTNGMDDVSTIDFRLFRCDDEINFGQFVG